MARLEIISRTNGITYRVILSRRNILALLHKLDMPGSARTLGNRYIYEDGQLVEVGAAEMFLVCEDDEEHYAGRDERPGEMHIDTEGFITERS